MQDMRPLTNGGPDHGWMEPLSNAKAAVSLSDAEAGFKAMYGLNAYAFDMFAESTSMPDLGTVMQHQVHFYSVPTDVTRVFYGTVQDMAALGSDESDLPPVKCLSPLGTATQIDLWSLFWGIAVIGLKSKALFKQWARVIRCINTCCFLHTQHA